MATEILDDAGLERAMQEYQGLAAAEPGSREASRRADLDAAIQSYYARRRQDLKPSRPEESGTGRTR
jgi:hypothetical protein